MKVLEALQIFVFKIVLPTADVFSDWIFGIGLMTNQGAFWGGRLCSYPEYHFNMGVLYLIPPSITALLHIHHWWHLEKIENGGSGRLKTLPFALLQCWPQFRYGRLLYLGLVKGQTKKWQKEKEFLDREISFVEPFVESLPQLFILSGYIGLDFDCFGPGKGLSGLFTWSKLNIATFSFVLAGNNLMTRGPFSSKKNLDILWQISMLPSLIRHWFLISAWNISHLAVPFLIQALTTFDKGYDVKMLNYCTNNTTKDTYDSFIFPGQLTFYFLLVGLLFIPQLVFYLIVLTLGIGLKSTLKLIVRYPFIALTSNAFIFAPINHESKFCFGIALSQQEKTIEFHPKLTALSVFIGVIFRFATALFIPLCDGHRVDFLLVISTSNQLNTVLMINNCINIALSIALYYNEWHGMDDRNCLPYRCPSYFRRGPGAMVTKKTIKALEIKSLDIYKYEETEEDEYQTEMTHL